VNFLFVMKHRGNAGNTHAVANYMRVAPKFGHRVAIYGTPVWYIRDLQFSQDIHQFDRVIYLFESELYRLNRLREAALFASFPKQLRTVIETDGMYNHYVSIDGYDSNHSDEAEAGYWRSYLDLLGSRIAQPVFGKPGMPNVRPLTFYGYDPALEMKRAEAPPKQYDIIHVAHNWWRWRDVETHLLPAFEQIRDQVGEIGFVGLWWDRPPPEGRAAGPEAAFQSDPERFQRLRIETRPAVMYHEVIPTMSSSKINILTQRPVLRQLKLLTLKYFEIFYADTIPLLLLNDDHAETVYGPAAKELTLPGRTSEKILDALRRPDHYRGVVQDVRKYLAANYTYDRRMAELVELTRN
jgi:hypothetical protein